MFLSNRILPHVSGVKAPLTANEEKKKGNIELLKAWTNTEMGETWEEEGQQIDTDDLYDRREEYGCEVPEEVLVLTAGVRSAA